MLSKGKAAKSIHYCIHVTGTHYGTYGSCSEYTYYRTSGLCSEHTHYSTSGRYIYDPYMYDQGFITKFVQQPFTEKLG